MARTWRAFSLATPSSIEKNAAARKWSDQDVTVVPQDEDIAVAVDRHRLDPIPKIVDDDQAIEFAPIG